MRKYETFFILDPDLPMKSIPRWTKKLQSVIASNGGTFLSCVPWEKGSLPTREEEDPWSLCPHGVCGGTRAGFGARAQHASG